MKKRTFILSFILLIAASILFLLQEKQPAGSYVEVHLDNQVSEVYALNTDGRFSLNNGTNTLLIENGKVCMEYADCPDRICVKQGWISKTGQTITCLPHRLTIIITGEKSEVDFVS